MPSQPCRYIDCKELIPLGSGGYCATHTLQVDRSYRGRGHRHLYGTKKWRVRSRAYLVRHPYCVKCGRMATEVDHVTPVEDGGGMWDEDNWQSMCHPCHSRKTNQDVRRRTFT